MVFDRYQQRLAGAVDLTKQTAYKMQKIKQLRLTLLLKFIFLAVISSTDGSAGKFSVGLMCVSLEIRVTAAKNNFKNLQLKFKVCESGKYNNNRRHLFVLFSSKI